MKTLELVAFAVLIITAVKSGIDQNTTATMGWASAALWCGVAMMRKYWPK